MAGLKEFLANRCMLVILTCLLFMAYLYKTRELEYLTKEANQIHLEKIVLEKRISELSGQLRQSLKQANNVDLLSLRNRRGLLNLDKADTSISRVPDSPRKVAALKAYHEGTGVLFHHHIMHCAGTALCKLITNLPKQDGGVVKTHMPACWPRRMTNKWGPIREENLLNNGRDLRTVEENVDFISWELPIVSMPWESNKITFITAFRHPISRMFATDGKVDKGPLFPEVRDKRMTPKSWENFTASSLSDNWLLRHVLGIPINNQRQLTRMDLEHAKWRLRQFTFILITEWLKESWSVLCEMMRWTDCDHYGRIERGECTKEECSHSYSRRKRYRAGQRDSNRKMIMNDTIYSDLLERNQYDIELYDYAVTLNLEQMQRHGSVNISGILSQTMHTHFDNQKYFSPHCGLMEQKCFWTDDELQLFNRVLKSTEDAKG